ncbi:DUF2917 domain-containing protein [Luteolibacter flavescens]|uniref:DUF2917 domain-containing protein n=1 Tax=Luteolibacter flavescens TaxID=1859460 RepID=A0ABT3FJK9_9BACT|nr:DUF2917 domain-containing protein [Luteolibacter flavescens]MCW1883529.1 DUF2917 domain-containing protein [Luteolibacter flavescens]
MKISLKNRAVVSLDLSTGDRLRLATDAGTAWVTMEGRADDLALTASQALAFSGPGRLVIEAIDGGMTIHATRTTHRPVTEGTTAALPHTRQDLARR